jgi:hypothetical protein
MDRRDFLNATGRFGLASTLFPGILYTLAAQTARAQDSDHKSEEPRLPKITNAMIDQAAALAGLTIPDDYKAAMLDNLNQQRSGYEEIRKLNLPNSVAPAFVFDPLPPGATLNTQREKPIYSKAPATLEAPSNLLEDLAFASAMELADLLRRKKISATNLTDMYLTRLKRYDATLHFGITVTEDRARNQAREADADIARGHYRGPLHGLPWGAKDLLAVKGYPTTWGAGGFEHQTIDEDATVVQRLDAAGAILIAKLTLGALAMGDKWYGGRTRNPWNTKQGSSGSSAGPASATSAGCVAFSIGSETLGSISSPSTRCGVTGLRPTFGFVPRTGAMALSWTMDKLGPICRAVEDCAAVLEAIHGPDGQDLSVRDAAFNWNADLDWKSLRIGYLKSTFDADPAPPPEKPAPANETAEQRNTASSATAKPPPAAPAAPTTASTTSPPSTSSTPWASTSSPSNSLSFPTDRWSRSSPPKPPPPSTPSPPPAATSSSPSSPPRTGPTPSASPASTPPSNTSRPTAPAPSPSAKCPRFSTRPTSSSPPPTAPS